MPWLAIGAQYYRDEGDGVRRQQRSRNAVLALPGTVAVNLQFADDRFDLPGFDNCAVLKTDSLTVTGRKGRRKPIVSEMFDALADRARTLGCSHFAYLNADIEVTPAALDLARNGRPDAVAYSRVDRDASSGRDLRVEICGLDLFVLTVEWWQRERRRFRPYIAGEIAWDNVYAALICVHGNGRIVSENPGIYHDKHPTSTEPTPFARYNGFLAALDSPYFARWVGYVRAVESATTYRWRPIGPIERAWHAGRQARARLRYGRVRRETA